VIADAGAGTAAAARLIAGLGHTRLAIVAWPGCGARLAGVRAGWGPDRPLPVIMAPGPGRRDGDPSGRAVLALEPTPTAVIALSDQLAFEVLDAAANAGLDVPTDVSVIGVDDLPGSAALGLTSVNVPYRPMGEQAANILWARIIGESLPEAVALPTELIVRSTTGAPRDVRRH
jgi:DNA-binding LacI/PurR family transcriptional regulator